MVKLGKTLFHPPLSEAGPPPLQSPRKFSVSAYALIVSVARKKVALLESHRKLMDLSILKAKSNFTLFCTEYINTRSDFKQIKYCSEFPTLALP